MQRFWKNNSLSIVLIGLFLFSLIGFMVSGYNENNDEKQDRNEPTVSFGEYLTSGDFIEPLFVNWESEFLQQFMYVVLTIFLFQKGSSESKKIDEPDPVDEDPARHRADPNAPAPVRKGGFVLTLYKNSLTLVFLGLFLITVVLHAWGGVSSYNEQQVMHGHPTITFFQFFATARFWSQSFQNWQSEFMSVFAIVTLGIFLRQQGSPESKPVHASNEETGH